MVRLEIGLEFVVIVPVATIVAAKPVYVPLGDKVTLLRFNVVLPEPAEVTPKFNVLNQLPVVNVTTPVPALPPVNVKLGLLVAEPPVVPNVNVLFILFVVVNPPVPLIVKLVAIAISILTAPTVGEFNIILLDPNTNERTLVLFETNDPISKSLPPRLIVPRVNRHCDVLR